MVDSKDDQKRDETLKRLLKTPPKPHVQDKKTRQNTKKPSGSARAKPSN